MFDVVYNRVRLDLTLRAVSPLLVKSGWQGADPSRPDMEFVRTRATNGGTTVFIPGSSLKGVVRSHCERLLRSEQESLACDPNQRDQSCGGKFGRQASRMQPGERYREVCRACQVFGSTLVASRVQFSDLLPKEPVETERRTGVGIDRLLGTAAPRALFDFEIAPAGSTFSGEVLVENYEAWQLGIIAAALIDLDAGFVRLGFGTSRGLGGVRVEVTNMIIAQKRHAAEVDAFRGVGELASGNHQRDYGYGPPDRIALEPMPPPDAGGGLLQTWTLDRGVAKRLLEEASALPIRK
jgi:CRISPR-associated protein Csm3